MNEMKGLWYKMNEMKSIILDKIVLRFHILKLQDDLTQSFFVYIILFEILWT